MRYFSLAPLSAALLLVACGGSDEDAAPVAGDPVTPPPSATAVAGAPDQAVPEVEEPAAGPDINTLIAQAITHPDRPADDQEHDAIRMPEETLEFGRLRPGLTVFEMEAREGYFTELLSRLVGPDGEVVMQNPSAFDSFLGEVYVDRLADGRLGNVRLSRTNFDQLDAPDGSIDIVTWFRGPHELWSQEEGESLGDPDLTFQEISRILKDGGLFYVIDHRAAPGALPESGGELRRVRPQVVINLADSVGLFPYKSAEFLANPDDTLELRVSDPEIVGQTDQFAMLFRKEE